MQSELERKEKERLYSQGYRKMLNAKRARGSGLDDGVKLEKSPLLQGASDSYTGKINIFLLSFFI